MDLDFVYRVQSDSCVGVGANRGTGVIDQLRKKQNAQDNHTPLHLPKGLAA